MSPKVAAPSSNGSSSEDVKTRRKDPNIFFYFPMCGESGSAVTESSLRTAVISKHDWLLQVVRSSRLQVTWSQRDRIGIWMDNFDLKLGRSKLKKRL